LFLIAAALSLSAPVTDEAPTYVECVPIARQQSGIQIYGDAHTWWNQAEGKYARGNAPRKGAVLAFKPHGAMTLGHVAAVSKVIDDRTILVTHANWSMINGRRGQIERNVRMVDVSEGGDWSRVRVWYAPLEDLGTTHWPTHGFIYPGGAVPKLNYASLDTLDERSAAPRPTGRLAYLGKMLGRLK
jgi:surface antigen